MKRASRARNSPKGVPPPLPFSVPFFNKGTFEPRNQGPLKERRNTFPERLIIFELIGCLYRTGSVETWRPETFNYFTKQRDLFVLNCNRTIPQNSRDPVFILINLQGFRTKGTKEARFLASITNLLTIKKNQRVYICTVH